MFLPPGKRAAGFTLIELLVSIAVLVMLILLISELFSSASATATVSRKHIDVDETARLVLDRVGSDFDAMVRRPDVNYIFYKQLTSGTNAGNDAMFFYSDGPGYMSAGATSTMSATGSASPMSLVGYRINSSNLACEGIPVLERLGESLTWGGSPDTSTGTYPGGMVFLTNPVAIQTVLAGNWSYTLGTPPYNGPASQADTNHFQLMSDSVFRMEFCFLLKSGTYSLSGTTVATGTTGYSNLPTAISASVPQPYVTTNYFSGGSLPDVAGNVYGFPPDLAGVVVTIAVLDQQSRKMIPGGSPALLAAQLKDSLSGSTLPGAVEANPQSTAAIWQSQLLQPGFAQAVNVPIAALQQVRVYERTYYLDDN